jgi:ABC-type glutathione transport system ATPase component
VVLLQGRDLSKIFPVEGGILRQRIGQVTALSGVSFEIAQGETLAVVGGSGCGKSTLAKIVAGFLPADSGELLWEGQPLASFTRLDRAHKIQMIFQDPYASLNPKLSIGTQLSEVLRLAESPVRAETLLDAVGLPADVLSHYPFQFSGGQRQRIAIARALAMRPDLLIADEPLSALDVTTQAQMLGLFGKLKEEYHLTFMFITHDLAVAQTFSDRIMVLENGKVVEAGPTRAVLQKPRSVYTQKLLAAVIQAPC